MFLKDLVNKTRRGLRGRVEKGKSGGGSAYGYDAIKRLDGCGETIDGERNINESQATIIRRLFRGYAKKTRDCGKNYSQPVDRYFHLK